MKELQIYLSPTPGGHPEFLATVRPTAINGKVGSGDGGDEVLWNGLLSSSGGRVVLEDYTRDEWSWKPQAPHILRTIAVTSIDGRNKIPGFMKYLNGRQKSAYGRVGTTTYLVVVSYIQSGSNNSPITMDCRICSDMTKIPNVTIRPKQQQNHHQQKNLQNQQQHKQVATTSTSKPPVPRSGDGLDTSQPAASVATKKSGLLGRLVGAQQRTNMHVAVSNAKTYSRNTQQQQQKKDNNNVTSNSTTPNNLSTSSQPQNNYENNNHEIEEEGLRTAQEVFAEFRQFCQDQMLDFDMADDELLKIPISLSEYTSDLLPEEKPKVTMELLKYMVFEAAEEVNEEWIPYKEPTEYMDEAVIVIYKEGAAPPEVLEDLNRGELPDEIIGQQRAAAEARQRLAMQAELKQKQAAEQMAHRKRPHDHLDDDDEDGTAALNQNKRDRRSMEEFQRDRQRMK